MFPAEAVPDSEHACVPAPPLSTVAGSVRAMMLLQISVTVNPVPSAVIGDHGAAGAAAARRATEAK